MVVLEFPQLLHLLSHHLPPLLSLFAAHFPHRRHHELIRIVPGEVKLEVGGPVRLQGPELLLVARVVLPDGVQHHALELLLLQ